MPDVTEINSLLLGVCDINGCSEQQFIPKEEHYVS